MSSGQPATAKDLLRELGLGQNMSRVPAWGWYGSSETDPEQNYMSKDQGSFKKHNQMQLSETCPVLHGAPMACARQALSSASKTRA